MAQELILGLDIGTSSVRAALYNVKGDMLPETFVRNERTLSATDDGGAEIDAKLAVRQVIKAVDDVLALAGGINGEITFVASSTFWHSLLGVDASGNPTTRLLGWADTRSRNRVEILRKRFDENVVHDRTGARFHSSFWPAKILWLRKERPDAFDRTAMWMSLGDLIALEISGEAITSVSIASGTGMFDQRECIWDKELARFLKVPLKNLPSIAKGEQVFHLAAKYRKRWPRLSEAKWFPAIADGGANNIGAGCVTRSKAALMIGTSGAMRVAYRGEPPDNIPNGLWCYRIDRERVIIGGALSDGGGLYHWMKENLKLKDDDNKVEAAIGRRQPAGHGLIVLPFLAGERSTGYNENAKGAILGLRTATDTIDIVQAGLESVAYRFAEIFDQMNSVCRIREIIASGGALRQSPVWTQMIADVIGRDLELPNTHEASMRGAVLLALETTGKIKSIDKLPTPRGRKFLADRSRKAIYAAARKQHQSAYKLLIDGSDPE